MKLRLELLVAIGFLIAVLNVAISFGVARMPMQMILASHLFMIIGIIKLVRS